MGGKGQGYIDGQLKTPQSSQTRKMRYVPRVSTCYTICIAYPLRRPRDRNPEKAVARALDELGYHDQVRNQGPSATMDVMATIASTCRKLDIASIVGCVLSGRWPMVAAWDDVMEYHLRV